jgi:hypothetical protein
MATLKQVVRKLETRLKRKKAKQAKRKEKDQLRRKAEALRKALSK